MHRKCKLSLFLLIVGTLIYVCCRQEVLFLIPFDSNVLSKIRIEIDYSNLNCLTYWLIFCLPDGLWYMALLYLQDYLYNDGLVYKMVFCMSVMLPFILEILQKYGIMSGTFDYCDILTYLLTYIFFWICQEKRFYQYWC